MSAVHKILERKGNSIFSVSPDTTVYEALRQMVERNVGALIVMDGSTFKGIFTERDYARKVMLKGRTSHDTLVRDIVTEITSRVSPNTSIDDCMSLMTDHFQRYLPVFENDTLIGIISIGDVVKQFIEDQTFALQQLESYIADSR